MGSGGPGTVDKFDDQGLWCWCRAVFAGQDEGVASFLHKQAGIGPGMDVGTSTQGLSGLGMVFFAGVVDQNEGQRKGPLEFSQKAQDPGHLHGTVFV